MRAISMQLLSEAATKLSPPPADSAFFYTAGRMLSYNRPTKNGMVFFRDDCKPVLDTIQNALSNVAHIKPGNEGAPDTYNLRNGVIGSIFEYKEDPEGIDIVCKNDRAAVNHMGFKEEDFSPSGRFASFSQESEFVNATSPYITVPLAKAKAGYFTPDDISKTYSFTEGRQLGLQPSYFDTRTQSWRYNTDANGDAIFVRLRPTSFTGVGHVIHPADTTAEIYRYTASVEGEEVIAEIYGKSRSSVYPSLDTPAMDTYEDQDLKEHPDLVGSYQDLSGYDIAFDTEAGDSAPYDEDTDDVFLYPHDLDSQKTLSKLGTPYGKDAKYADPGYQGDKKRYPLDTPEHIAAAARYWGMPRNKNKYTPNQQKQIGAKIAAAQRRTHSGSYSDQSYSAVYTTPHPEQQGKFMVNRRFRMVDDNGNLDRSKLVSAYQALAGFRGNTALADNMPQPVRNHALALVRQGLKLTKPNKELSMENLDLSPHIKAELDELREKAQSFSSEKTKLIEQKDAEIAGVRQEFSQYKEAQEALVTDLRSELEGLKGQLAEVKAKELSSTRLAALEAIHPYSTEEKAEEKFGEFVKSLSTISEDRMETLMVRQELAKTRAERNKALSFVKPTTPTVSPAPTFEGLGKGLEISSPSDIL